ncbi:MAG: hypothetical protein K8R69_05710, partial [Deltaproteobacteria bacterium]|nr:hypothetical protein [Deltaproteobacteria bacterium]
MTPSFPNRLGNGYLHSRDIPRSAASSAIALVLAQVASASNDANPESRALLHLNENLTQAPSEGLRSAFQRLPMAEREALTRRLGADWNEFLSLETEADADLFFSGLLNLGQRSQAGGNAALSGAIFQVLAEGPPALRGLVPNSLHQRALGEFNAMRGVGGAGRRFEFLARNFVREASDPGMILGMGVAGTVFGAMRLGVLSRLAARPAAWWTRGVAASFLASSAAFPAEVLAFWGSTRAYGMAMHPETLRWDRGSISHELASLTLTLGLLKLSGAASGQLFDRVHGINPATGEIARLPGFTQFSRQAFAQLGMFGGIAAGHYAETRLGLRPSTSGDTFWTDSLVTLLQFNVGGRLSQEALGPRHAAMMQELAFRTQGLESSTTRPNGPFSLFRPMLALSVEGIANPFPEAESAARPVMMAMSTIRPEGKGVVASSVSTEGRSVQPNGLEAPFRGIINGLFNEEISDADRFQLSQELNQDLPLAREVFRRMRETGEIAADNRSAEAYQNLDAKLYHVNLKHFESVSDRMQEWHVRFQFLQRELRSRVNEGSKNRRREIRRLLESVELKLLETRRYHHDAESYLGDVKGPSSKSVFSATKYGRLLQRFTDISTRLERYIEGKTPLAGILSRFQGLLPSRIPTRVDSETILEEIKGTPLSPIRQGHFRQAVAENDFVLGQYDWLPLSLWFRDLKASPASQRARKAWRSIGEYVEVADQVRRALTPDAFREWQLAHEKLMLGEEDASRPTRLLRDILSVRARDKADVLAKRMTASIVNVAASLARFRPAVRS